MPEKKPKRKEAQREPGVARHGTAHHGTARHGTAHHTTARLPGKETDWLVMAPGASKTTWGSVEVALTGLCAVLLCCSPMLAGCRQVTFFPDVLTLPAGSSATFFCNISMEHNSGSEYSLNWYKETNHSQAQKIAEISRNNSQTKTEKYLLTNHTPAFKIRIMNLHQNDSGSYYCGLITFFEPNKVMESNRSQLVVTAAPEKTNATKEPEVEEDNPLDHIKAVLLGILLLAGAVLLLIFGYLTITYKRGDVQKPPSEKAPAADHAQSQALLMHFVPEPDGEKEEKPPEVFMSTVDYGVLEFQWDQRTQVPPETQPVDQTEYATIIFPEEKPVTPERGKKHQNEKTQQLQLQPC
ncbi:PREDICTED: programmed cell death protein 1 [Eurypyga helias]|uniref:programmed cell death protein 1 n=1 Tax=Eurypyga helias TaxID=54383 RepID=UPI000529498D|nr:PREDICTED: programmed cell death protein 1 [Eurypyga helias]